MKKTRIISFLMSALMVLTAVPFVAAPVAAAEADPVVAGNLIVDGDCSTGIPEGFTGRYTLEWNENGYVETPETGGGSTEFGITYTANTIDCVDSAHAYLFSFRVRTKDQGVESRVRLYGPSGGTAVPLSGYESETNNFFIKVNNEWKTYTFRIDSNTNSGMFTGGSIGIRLQGPMANMKALCLDSFVLIDLSEKQGLGYNSIFEGGTSAADLAKWVPTSTNKVTAKTSGGIDYINVSNITVNYAGTNFNSGCVLDPGKYEVTLKLRTAVAGETTGIRVYNSFRVVDGDCVEIRDIGNRRVSVHVPITVTSPGELKLTIKGVGSETNIQSYDVSEIKIYSLDIPEGDPDNLVVNGGFNSTDKATNLAGWSDGNGGLTTELASGSGVISISARNIGYVPATFDTGVKIESDTNYKLTFRVRTADLDASGYIRVFAYTLVGDEVFPVIIQDNPYAIEYHPSLYAVNGEWATITAYINSNVNSDAVGTDSFKLGIYGSPVNPFGYPQLFIDDVCITEVVKEEKDVKIPNIGIIMMLMHKNRVAKEDAEPKWTPTNLIAGADTADSLSKWTFGDQSLEAKTEGELNYLAASNITVNYAGFYYNPDITLEPGTYKLSLSLRTSVAGEKTQLRVFPRFDKVNQDATFVELDNNWKNVEITFEVPAKCKFEFYVAGGPVATYIQNYDIANISLVDVNEQPPAAE